MADTEKPLDPLWAWEPYRGDDKKAPWNLQRAGHLYRRASFGATMAQLQQAVKDGPDKTIDRLLAGGPGLDAFEKSTDTLAASIANGNNGQQLRAWWLNRMLYSPHPLREKIALFWHNHFATSNAKVQNARFMLGQYELMKRHALGSFEKMLQEMSHDPAMMIWLDTRGSKKGNPNENYAREIMELFSLGVGNYTEADIREAARAFTGWEIQGTEAVFKADAFDDGEKKVLGQTGKFKGPDIVRICLEQSSCPKFIITKFFRFMVSETIAPTPELIQLLADKFKSSGYDFGVVVNTVLLESVLLEGRVSVAHQVAGRFRARHRSRAGRDYRHDATRGGVGKAGAERVLPAVGEGLGRRPVVAERPDAAVPPEPGAGHDLHRGHALQ